MIVVCRREFDCCLQERGYLDTIFTAIGAVLGFQNCSEVGNKLNLERPFSLATDLETLTPNLQILFLLVTGGSLQGWPHGC